MKSWSGVSERDTDAQRKRNARSETARIEIPACRNPVRREQCLADPERFMRTYFPERYGLPFGKDHRFIIQSVVDVAQRGGKQAIAAPRGRGKSEVVKGLLVYLVTAQLSRFLVAMAATTPLANRLFQDFKRKIANSDLLLEDFPEVCWPVRCLEGAPQRAARQHVDGVLTKIVWTGDYISIAHVPDSPYGGVKMAYSGLDSAFRGMNIDGDRPDLVLIDDPETKESAKSEMQIEDRETMLDQDIAGLVGQDSTMGIVVTSTVQNWYCLSAKLTTPSIKPAYNGKRFGLIETWPTHMSLWEEYIAMRRADQQNGDTLGLNAVLFYAVNRDEMDAGVSMISDHVNQIEDAEGRPTVLSAIQQAFNKIADTSMSAFKTEYQNDPDPDEEPETVGLTAGKVASRISGYDQGQLPPDTEFVTIGCDIGKYYSHWAKIAWHGNAIGCIVDYGVIETPSMTTATDSKAVMAALLPALLAWRTDMIAESQLDFCLVDSGDYTDAVYEFIRTVGGTPFAAAKGWDKGRFNVGKDITGERKTFIEAYAQRQAAERIWLYNVNTEYWKQWTHERFATKTFDDQNQRNDATLSLYSCPDDVKRHISISHHVVAEERRDVFVQGKGNVRKWIVKSRNNHYLDAIALACAAAGCLGVRVVPRVSMPSVPVVPSVPRPAILTPHGQPFLATERK
jgi:hypothetical protein